MSLPFPDPQSALEIEPGFLHELRQGGGSGYVLLDCREDEEHSFCHISGDVLVPLSRFVASIEGVIPDLAAPVIVYCHHGMRSAQAASFLRAKGHVNAFSLRGGIEAWSLEVDPAVPRY